jgi:transketolase
MKQQLPPTIDDALRANEKVVLLFGDVGTFGFRNSQADFKDRVHNMGILEPAMISAAAGLAMQGLIPVVHTIAAFLVERSFEQLKDDFGYQGLGGNFISIGASYDLASWGCTHESPGEVGELKNIPGMEIVVPGHASEFDALFKQSYDDGKSTYFRLSNKENSEGHEVAFGKATVIKTGKQATVIAVGPMLTRVQEACKDLDVTILYYTTLQPFDHATLRENLNDHVIVCEPYYSGAIAVDIATAAAGRSIQTTYIGVPREFPHHYGTADDLDAFFHLTGQDIKERINDILKKIK